MVRFCGQCGSSLTTAALHAGRCPVCGIAIEDSGDALAPADAVATDAPTLPPADASMYSEYSEPEADAAGTRTSHTAFTPVQQSENGAGLGIAAAHGTLRPGPPVTNPKRRRQPARWALALLLAVPLILICASAAVLTQTGALAGIFTPSASSHSGPTAGVTASRSAGRATSTTGTASHSPTQSPAPGGTPSVTASPTATATPLGSPVAGPAYLSVSPQVIKVNIVLCVAGTAHTQFTVANNGGTRMEWSATANQDYMINPSSGTIAAGENQTVTINAILLSGSVTVTAPYAANSPQQVTIRCIA